MWDEDTFGLEYDLDVYNIVAVNDFNMGAMENKGLNVFNTALTLADPKSATDSDYERVSTYSDCQYFCFDITREIYNTNHCFSCSFDRLNLLSGMSISTTGQEIE